MPAPFANKPKLLLVESDALTIARITRGVARLYDVLVERDVERATSIVTMDTSVTVVVAGVAGDGTAAHVVLGLVKAARSGVLRVMLAGDNDLAAVVAGLHSGVVERTIQKPVDEAELLAAVTPRVAGGSAGSVNVAARLPNHRRTG
jgi:ActR/RegA family two-component response regulator